MVPRIHLITLGVADVEASTAFYERLGLVRSAQSVAGAVAFFQVGPLVLSVFGRAALAEDAGLTAATGRPDAPRPADGSPDGTRPDARRPGGQEAISPASPENPASPESPASAESPASPVSTASAESPAGDGGQSAFSAVTIACNVASPAEVEAVMARAAAAGARVTRPPSKAFWGGYTAYFADPDGHLWEVAHNPFWSFDATGAVRLPD
ncbi:VOC family protein [Prosthecomicrobium hirschii]|uniref:VOC family protein n=1 Tax=Prosthecodimorpha hirschii TaxID=665126 RepID=UPI0022206E1A|nr:VOC family protein [Prosthecomicrobium hirschii]MCW1843206.1 VOC family protein [Prosthecomicrobium hirschii]